MNSAGCRMVQAIELACKAASMLVEDQPPSTVARPMLWRSASAMISAPLLRSSPLSPPKVIRCIPSMPSKADLAGGSGDENVHGLGPFVGWWVSWCWIGGLGARRRSRVPR